MEFEEEMKEIEEYLALDHLQGDVEITIHRDKVSGLIARVKELEEELSDVAGYALDCAEVIKKQNRILEAFHTGGESYET